MRPHYIEIAKLFSNDERFQRPYVWIKEEQWEPLWDDIGGVLRSTGGQDRERKLALQE